MKPNNEVLSLEQVCTTQEQAVLNHEPQPLFNLDLKIHREEHQIILINPNSSKKQLIGVFTGDLQINTGCLKVLGKEITHLSHTQQKKFLQDQIGFVNHDKNLIPLLTVLENLYIGFWYSSPDIDRYRIHIQALIHWFSLEKKIHHLPNQLSPLEIFHVNLIKAFIHQPKLVFIEWETSPPSAYIYEVQRLAQVSHTSLLILVPRKPKISIGLQLCREMQGGMIVTENRVVNEPSD